MIAAMISRTGMAWTLLISFTCSRVMRLGIFACMLVQVVVNTIAILQIVLQCGPYPHRSVSMPIHNSGSADELTYRAKTNRLNYFHYMWDTVPADGPVRCQSSSVQMTVGLVQGSRYIEVCRNSVLTRM